MMEHEPREVCEHCGQSLTYELSIDRGSCDILKALVAFIGKKGINAVHPNKEMVKTGIISARQLDNIVRLKFHGLVAHIDGERGNYSITRKGFEFMDGAKIPKAVIVKKAAGGKRAHVIAHSLDEVTMKSFDGDWEEYWSANGYTIEEGRVITKPPVKGTLF